MSDKNEETNQENIGEDKKLENSTNETKALFSFDRATGKVTTNKFDVPMQSEYIRNIIQKLRNYY